MIFKYLPFEMIGSDGLIYRISSIVEDTRFTPNQALKKIKNIIAISRGEAELINKQDYITFLVDIKKDKKIASIKQLRTLLPIGLKQSKEYVEYLRSIPTELNEYLDDIKQDYPELFI